MFPQSAGPRWFYKLCFPVKCDGDLNRFLQNKPSAEGQRHVPSAHQGKEKACEWQGGEARTETKEIKPCLLPGSISNLFFCSAQLNLRAGKGGCTGVSTTATWGHPVLPSAVPRLGPSEGLLWKTGCKKRSLA